MFYPALNAIFVVFDEAGRTIKLKIAQKVICLFRGHVYSRFERRTNPVCITCGSGRKRLKDRKTEFGADTIRRMQQELSVLLIHEASENEAE
jgi:hypothetical protein